MARSLLIDKVASFIFAIVSNENSKTHIPAVAPVELQQCSDHVTTKCGYA